MKLQSIKLHCPCENSLFHVDFYCATEQTFGNQELIRTDLADHNIWLAGYVQSKGLRLKYNEGLMKDEVAVARKTEEKCFHSFGSACPEPQIRISRRKACLVKFEYVHLTKPKDACGKPAISYSKYEFVLFFPNYMYIDLVFLINFKNLYTKVFKLLIIVSFCLLIKSYEKPFTGFRLFIVFLLKVVSCAKCYALFVVALPP